MSQIPHSQLALKKRSTPVVVLENDIHKAVREKTTKNGHKAENGNKDKDIIILDDEYDSIPVGRDEFLDDQVLTQPDDASPIKKKRGRKPKGSTDSRDSSDVSKKEEISMESNDDLHQADTMPTPETKIVKLTGDLLPVSSTKRRSDRFQNASTIVNLSTVSSTDLSTKVSNDTTVTLETPSTERRVSGRRSTRPVDDLKFTYRSPDPDESVANATIGSELGDSLLQTPLTGSKRRMDSTENVESPKRSRLDLSALFNNFYSPVTLLRDKFRRTNLVSTPKADGILDESTNSIDTSATDMKEIDLNEKSEELKTAADDEHKSDGSLKFIVKPAPKKSSCSIM